MYSLLSLFHGFAAFLLSLCRSVDIGYAVSFMKPSVADKNHSAYEFWQDKDRIQANPCLWAVPAAFDQIADFCFPDSGNPLLDNSNPAQIADFPDVISVELLFVIAVIYREFDHSFIIYPLHQGSIVIADYAIFTDSNAGPCYQPQLVVRPVGA